MISDRRQLQYRVSRPGHGSRIHHCPLSRRQIRRLRYRRVTGNLSRGRGNDIGQSLLRQPEWLTKSLQI